MNLSRNTLRSNIELGRPSDDFVDELTKHELGLYVKDAEQTSLLAHAHLMEGFATQSRHVIAYTDDLDQPDKYLSFADTAGDPMYGPWNPSQPATDIGIRSANPEFTGIVNPTTVVHADTYAVETFRKNGAPAEVVDAITAVAQLNEFVVNRIAKSYLKTVAEAYGIDPAEYQANFFATERGRREQILTRVIMYHLVAAPGQRPIGSDGTPLLIREHNDKGSWTFDIHQTAPGLQYQVDNAWQDATTEVTAFRGLADSYLPLRTPPTLHRAVNKEYVPDASLAAVGIGRIAVPMFVSPIRKDARVIASNSAETHPTELAIDR